MDKEAAAFLAQPHCTDNNAFIEALNWNMKEKKRKKNGKTQTHSLWEP